MHWKYAFPDPWTDPAQRVALEDIYLIPPDDRAGLSACWLTLEGLRSFTGGTHEEKLDRLGGAEFTINDSMDMLIRREDFDKEELLAWVRVFIREQFGDPSPVLGEASDEERARHLPHLRGVPVQQSHEGRMRLLFVHPRGGVPHPFPEGTLGNDIRIEVQSMPVGDEPLNEADTALMAWADLVIVMEKRMRQIIRRRLKQAGKVKRVVCLHLPEHHDVRDPAYLALFRERIDVYLEKLAFERIP